VNDGHALEAHPGSAREDQGKRIVHARVRVDDDGLPGGGEHGAKGVGHLRRGKRGKGEGLEIEKGGKRLE